MWFRCLLSSSCLMHVVNGTAAGENVVPVMQHSCSCILFLVVGACCHVPWIHLQGLVLGLPWLLLHRSASIDVLVLCCAALQLMTQNRLSTASDVYSFAIIMYEMLTWQMPFHDLSKEQVGGGGHEQQAKHNNEVTRCKACQRYCIEVGPGL